MKKLLVYLKGYGKETVFAPLFKLLEATFELFVPLVMAAVIDTGIANRDRPYIVRMCLLLITLGIIGLVCSITAQYFAAKAATGFSTALRHSLFAHIQGLGYTEMDTVGTSTLITRMTSDINQVQSGINLVLRLFMRSPFIVFGSMIMAFTVDTRAALVFVVIIPLLSLVVFGIMLGTMPLYKKVQAGLDRVLLATRENLTGVRVIRAFNKEEEERKRFEKENQILTDAQKFAGRISGLMNPLTYIIVDGGIIALIYVGAIRVDTGVLSQGEVVALVSYMSQILVELVKLANLIITVSKAIACGNRIQAVMEMKPAMQNGTVLPERKGAETAVEFAHVSLTYKDAGAQSLEDITFSVRPGETVGIIGGTGSGKSSLVNLIPRFYDATKGQVKVWGKDVREYKKEALRQEIGMVPQKAVLFAGTIAENLRWGNEEASREEMEEALRISQAWEFVEKKEKGMDTPVEQGGRNLSGGQKQRLTIARALVRKPGILILDDSASALDYATDAKLRRSIREMPGSPAVFLVSQRAASVRHADKIIVLDDGEAVGMGTHEELLKTCPVYQEIYYSQFPKEVQAE
ncbi:MAG TPA: ABC transporter ATP-binding protein/permease [Candidatus Bariatricus faecipullorum]|nr:ABC transporter ATP-binding protein/permease [Candidatus Bariatricus faecipullorum]